MMPSTGASAPADTSKDLATITTVNGLGNGRGDTVPAVAHWWCRNCGQRIVMVVDANSGCIDWHADGDFGCGDAPDSDEDGVGNHHPTLDTPGFRSYWTRVRAQDALARARKAGR